MDDVIRVAVWMGLAGIACAFDSGGVAEAGGSAESSGTDGSASTSNPSTSDPSTSSPSTSDPSTTSPSTTSPSTTDPSTTSPSTTSPSTSDPSTTTDESSGDTATSDPTGVSGTESSTDPTQGTSSGGDGPDPYAPCVDDMCPGDQICAQLTSNNMFIADICQEPCGAVEECAIPETGDPEVICPTPNYPYCVLACAMGPCPDGMSCYNTQFGPLCYWDY